MSEEESRWMKMNEDDWRWLKVFGTIGRWMNMNELIVWTRNDECDRMVMTRKSRSPFMLTHVHSDPLLLRSQSSCWTTDCRPSFLLFRRFYRLVLNSVHGLPQKGRLKQLSCLGCCNGHCCWLYRRIWPPDQLFQRMGWDHVLRVFCCLI